MKTYDRKYGGISRSCDKVRNEKGTPIDGYTIILPVIVFISALVLSFVILIAENLWKFCRQPATIPAKIDEQYSTKDEQKSINTLSINSFCSH